MADNHSNQTNHQNSVDNMSAGPATGHESHDQQDSSLATNSTTTDNIPYTSYPITYSNIFSRLANSNEINHAHMNVVAPLIKKMAANKASVKGKQQTVAHFSEKVVCPMKEGNHDCIYIPETFAQFFRHVTGSHSKNGATNIIVEDLLHTQLVNRCSKCDKPWATAGITRHKNACKGPETQQLNIQERDGHYGQFTWPWNIVTAQKMREICSPGLVLSKNMHPYIVGEVTLLMKKILQADKSPEQRILTTLFCIQYILCHPERKTRLQQLAEQKTRLYKFNAGKWLEAMQYMLKTMEENRERWKARDTATYHWNAKINSGKVGEVMMDNEHKMLPSKQFIEEHVLKSQFPGEQALLNQEQGDQVEEDVPPQPQQSDQIELDQEILQHVFRYNNETTGCTGISGTVWKQLYATGRHEVTKIIASVVNNTMPSTVRDIIRTCNLTILKRNDSDKNRTVGSHDALIKIAAKYLLIRNKQKITDFISEFPEHAIQQPRGMSTMCTRLLSALMEKRESEEEFAVLSIDVKGAFPNSDRNHMRQELSQKFPDMVNVFDFMYRGTNIHNIMTNDGEIARVQQRTGLVQGSEMSMMLFALLSSMPLKEYKATWMDVMCKYADDMYIYGDIEQVTKQYTYITNQMTDIGLNVQPKKTKLLLNNVNRNKINQVKKKFPECDVTTDGMIVLGVPIGTDTYIKEQLDKRRIAYNMALDDIAKFQTKQQVLKVLQVSASMHQHLIAVLPPRLTDKFCKRIDKHLFNTFKKTFLDQVVMTDSEWENTILRIRLPIRLQGFGILSLQDRAMRAFFTTAAATRNLAREHQDQQKTTTTTKAWEKFQRASGMKEALQMALQKIKEDFQGISDDQCMDKSMRELMAPYYERVTEAYKDNATQAQVRIMRNLNYKGATDVLAAWPNRKETRLADREMLYEVRTKLGVGAKECLNLNDGGDCAACGQGPATSDHMASCHLTRKWRHDEVVRAVMNVAEEAGQKPIRERLLGNTQMRADVWYQDRVDTDVNNSYVLVDVTVVQHYRTTNNGVVLDSKTQMSTAATAKHTKYTNIASDLNASVLPLPFTTLGAHNGLLTKFLKNMATAAERQGCYFKDLDRKAEIVWRENISFAVARSTAQAAYKSASMHITNSTTATASSTATATTP